MPTSKKQARERGKRNRSRQRKAGDHDPRHGRRGDHIRRRRGSGTQRDFQPHRIADADGHHPPGQAHRWPLAEDQGLCSAGRPQRPGLHRLGHLRRRHVLGRAQGGRARSLAAGAGQAVSLDDQAAQGGLRQELREEARRAEREEGQEQDGSGRAAARRHPRLQEVQRRRPAGDDLVRLDRDLHRGRARCINRWRRSKRACTPTTRTSRLR